MSIFNALNRSFSFEPVNLYNWSIEFILDDDAYKFMNGRYYADYSKTEKDEDYPFRNYSWEEQSNILTFMCKKCNLPKKKLSEVKTYCRGMEASFNGGITIDSSLSLSFDESSSRIVSRILTNLSNFYASSRYIYLNMSRGKDEMDFIEPYSPLEKVNLANAGHLMVNGNKSENFKGYVNDEEFIQNGQFIGDANRFNRDLTIVVKMYHNKYGYLKPMDYIEEEKPLFEYTFYKCFVNNLKYGDGFEYGSEENLSIDCEIIYNWYTTKSDMNKLEGYANNKGSGESSGDDSSNEESPSPQNNNPNNNVSENKNYERTLPANYDRGASGGPRGTGYH